MSSQLRAQMAYSPEDLDRAHTQVGVVHGEQLTLALRVLDGHSGLPEDLSVYQSFAVHLPGQQDAVIKRGSIGFEVQPRQVRVGDATVDLVCPGHGLVSGDWLRFDSRAPLAWQQAAMRRQALAYVVDPSSFYPVDADGNVLMPGLVSRPFNVSMPYDLSVEDAAAGVLSLRLRSPVSALLAEGLGQAVELHLTRSGDRTIVPILDVLDVSAGLGD